MATSYVNSKKSPKETELMFLKRNHDIISLPCSEVYLKPCLTSKMGRFTKIVSS